MKNTVTLVGFVGNTPEVRTAQSGASITSLSLATTRSFKSLPRTGSGDGEGNRQTETEWHRITCLNGVGKCVAEHVTKGAMDMVTGRIHYSRLTDSEGQTRYGCEIIAEQVDFLAKAKEASSEDPKKRRSK
ncbi:MAG: single-stranded DNA-binding protein [Erythrobacter sp.]